MTTSNTSKRSFRTRVSVLEVVSLSSKPDYYGLTASSTTYLHFKVCSDRSVPFRLVRIGSEGQLILDAGFLLPRDSVLYNWTQFPPAEKELLTDEDPLSFGGLGFCADWHIHCRNDRSDFPELLGNLHETPPLILFNNLPDYVPTISPVVVEARKVQRRIKKDLPRLAPANGTSNPVSQIVAPAPVKTEAVATPAELPVLKSAIGKMEL